MNENTKEQKRYIELPSGFRVYELSMEEREYILRKSKQFTLKDWFLVVGRSSPFIMLSILLWVIVLS